MSCIFDASKLDRLRDSFWNINLNDIVQNFNESSEYDLKNLPNVLQCL